MRFPNVCKRGLVRGYRTLCSGPAARPLLRPPFFWTSFQQQCRGAKRSSTLKLKELPQGVLESKSSYDEVQDVPQYPTVLQGVRNNISKFKNCVILTRVGGFYEIYFEQAEEYATLLGLRCSYRKTALGPVAMAGFPFYQLDRYLKLLVQDLQKYVAISEEFSNDAESRAKSGGLLFDRRVARIVTPGTLIDENFMDPYENNFLLAVHVDVDKGAKLDTDDNAYLNASTPCGLAWLDLSTGDFFTQATTLQTLPSAAARISAREIVLSDIHANESWRKQLEPALSADGRLLTFFPGPTEIKDLLQWNDALETPLSVEASHNFSSLETTACNILLQYVKDQMQGLKINVQAPMRKEPSDTMIIDRNSLRGLEILVSARDGLGKGSLLHAVRRTTTKSGARLLRDRLTSPSTSVPVINERLDLVSKFTENSDLRQAIINRLKDTHDAPRLAQKFSLGRGDADDLLSLAKTIEASKNIHSILTDHISSFSSGEHEKVGSLQQLVDRFRLDGPLRLSKDILEAIDEEGLSQKHRMEEVLAANAASMAQEVVTNEGDAEDLDALPKKAKKTSTKAKDSLDAWEDEAWIMRRAASRGLEISHENLERLHEERTEMSANLRESTGIPTLSLKWTSRNGYTVHIKGSKVAQSSLEAIGARTVHASKSSRSFHLPAWTQLGARIDEAKARIRAEEQRLFERLREQVITNLVKLRRNSSALDELDVSCSFATLAEEQMLVRPIVNTGTSLHIVGGRHPTVKLGLEEAGRSFTSNDCLLNRKERVWLITGPNMAGKSTFLRQNALISILAQAGSFVPAEYAKIGIADQIFSRIGAADDLFRDQSTFMVEMLETAAILNNATSRSFVIMDEVGRGTTPEDGTAVGFACLKHLHNVNKCRTLFATHFHSLADMTADFGHLGCYCTDVREGTAGSFAFDHKLRKGVNRNSHALKVAQLAGIPKRVLADAQVVRDKLAAQQ